MTIEDEVTGLQLLDLPALEAKYVEVFGKPPRFRNRVMLWRQVAWKLQERHHGGLSKRAKARLEQLVSEIQLPTEPPPKVARVRVLRPRAPEMPGVGTTLTRTWHGRELRVTVVAGGFEHEGTVYKSLSAAAKGITGSAWNGKLFFGLTARKADA